MINNQISMIDAPYSTPSSRTVSEPFMIQRSFHALRGGIAPNTVTCDLLLRKEGEKEVAKVRREVKREEWGKEEDVDGLEAYC